LGRTVDVSREWRELTRAMTPSELVTAAALGARLGLVTESIFTLARSDYWDDLDLRFPLPYRDLILSKAAAQGLPADWVYAIIRQESAFDADIASHAGAVGLMQLMPATAAEVARDAGLDAPSTLALTDPG
jgi:soluble lytic murein transglycosylase